MTTAEIAKLFNAKAIAKGRYQALCAAHPDHSPSLTITEGQDGRTLLKCWAGCPIDKIIAAGGLRKRDLFGECRPVTEAERQALEKCRRKAAMRADALKSIDRRTFDAERLLEIDLRRWGAALARLPEGHPDEQAMTMLFHLHTAAFRQATAASLSLLEGRKHRTVGSQRKNISVSRMPAGGQTRATA